MARVRKQSYWELPDWKNAKIEVTKMYQHNDKVIVVLMSEDERYFHVRRPKNKLWNAVTVGSKMDVTKVKRGEKNAVLKINAWL